MKISELVAKLNAILAVEGDLEVTCWPYDGQGQNYRLNTIEVRDTSADHDRHGNLTFAEQRIVNVDV